MQEVCSEHMTIAKEGLSAHIKNIAEAGSWFCKDYAGPPPPGVVFPLGNTSFFRLCRDFRG